MADILQVIKKAAVDAVEANSPTQVLFGFVENLNPLEIRLNQQLLLTEKYIILGSTIRVLLYNNQLEKGSRVLLIREQGGQKYLASDIIPDEAWLPEYSKGEDGRGVSSIVDEYSVNDSFSVMPTQGWSVVAPNFEKGRFLWVRTKIIYTNPTEIVYSQPVCDKSWEAVNEFIPQMELVNINVTQTAESIRHEVENNYLSYGEFEQYKSTSIEQTEEKIEFQFQMSKALSDEIAEDLKSEIQTRQSYIRFENGQIELGQLENIFKAVLDNEALRFKENDEDIAYISNKALNIKDAKVDGDLQIRNFRWQARENGNLSLVMI